MSSNLFKYSLLLVLTSLLQITSTHAATTPNLLLNGDAESHRCTNDWTAQTSIPGWRVVRGAASVMCYSAFATAHEAVVTPIPQEAGNALFAAPGADTQMEQTIDVSASATAIDRSKVEFILSGWLGGWRDRPESAALTAVFLDANGNSTGLPRLLTNASANERNNLTSLVAHHATGLVPPLTRQILVTVNFLSGMTSFQNAYADNLSLVLRGEVASIQAPTMPIATDDSGVPPLDHIYVVMMENTNYADIVHQGLNNNAATIDSRMPFLASLAAKGVILTNMWGAYHPSDENYIAMVSGDTFKSGLAYFPYDLRVSHLGDKLDSVGKSWSAYVQNMQTPCNLVVDQSGGWYSPDDEPFAQFYNVIHQPQRCAATMRDLTDFTAAIAQHKLPTFAWLAADGYSNGEGAWLDHFDISEALAVQDAFLQATFKPLLDSQDWKNSRSLLLITWDENQSWAWPDNHVATLLIGSPGVLTAGAVIDQHYDSYSVLRTIEKALNLGGFERFDTYAQPLTGMYQGTSAPITRDLRPAESIATRGSIRDTFGRVEVTAAVQQGDPVMLLAPANLPADATVSFVPFGQVPTASSPRFQFTSTHAQVTIPTTNLAPGVYGAWLGRSTLPPSRAPLAVTVLPPGQVTANAPGLEIVGMPTNTAGVLNLREGSNFVVHYCRPHGANEASTWIGIFPAGTPESQMTKDYAISIGSYWLRTPGTPVEQACGEAEAFSAELNVGMQYEIVLLVDAAHGAAKPVGHAANFILTPALP